MSRVIAFPWCACAVAIVAISTTVPQQLRADALRSLSGRLLFHPLLANQIEPRVGVEKALDENFLTLNIGNSIDLLAWRNVGSDSSSELRAGADFFTWSHLQSGNDFRFPVEAIDYLFGVNASWVSRANQSDRWEARFRLSHISAHAVDGMYDNYSHQWIRREPFTYSREFIDLLAARALHFNDWQVRILAGGTLLLHSIPAIFAAVIPHVGFEVHGNATSFVVPFVAYDGTLQRVDAWRATNALHAGVKFGGWDATGTELYVAYESGASVHGERYDLSGSHFMAGMNIAF